MFSFGMLVYQKVPYERMKVKEIQNHVLNMKRQTFEILMHQNLIATELAKLIRRGNYFFYI